MTPAERFVVVAGVSLLVFNLILFSLCISLVLDSRAARNDTVQLIALTGRLLQNQPVTPLPYSQETTTMSSAEKPQTTIAQEVVEGCPLLLRRISPSNLPSKKAPTQEVTEVTAGTEPGNEYEATSISEPNGVVEKKSMEERIISLEKLVGALLKKSSELATTPLLDESRRRRSGEWPGVGDGGQSLSFQLSLLITMSLFTLYHCIRIDPVV